MSDFIIEFKPDTAEAVIQQYLVDNSCDVLAQFVAFGSVIRVSADVEPPVTDDVLHVVEDASTAMQLMAYDQTIEFEAPTVEFDIPDQKNWWKVASLFTPNYDASVETHTLLGAGATVYLLDSGIEIDHPEFVGADVELFHSFTSDFVDTRGHGTALASVIVGATCGLTNAKLKVVKIFDSSVATKQSDLLAAFEAIIADYEANGRKPAVVNMSWNIAKNEFIESKIVQMIQLGLICVVAAGNDGAAVSDRTPASIPMVFTIGSYGEELTPSDFSNYTGGSEISYATGTVNSGALDGWAPGEGIYAAALGGLYGNVAGTSIAAAIHSASVAYNIVQYVDSSGTYAYGDMTTDKLRASVSMSSLGRQGLLYLGGQYAESVNKITTFYSHAGDKQSVVANARGVFNSGGYVHLNLFNARDVKSVHCGEDLPPGFVIDNGFLRGTPEVITEGYLFYERTLVLSLFNDETQTILLEIGILPEGVERNSIEPNGDPELDIILSGLECCGITATGFSCTTGNECMNYCMTDTKNGSCYCESGTC